MSLNVAVLFADVSRILAIPHTTLITIHHLIACPLLANILPRPRLWTPPTPPFVPLALPPPRRACLSPRRLDRVPDSREQDVNPAHYE
jgi:hypothetical protein